MASAAIGDCPNRNGVIDRNAPRQTSSVPSRADRASRNLMPARTIMKATDGSRPSSVPYVARIISAADDREHDERPRGNARRGCVGSHAIAREQPQAHADQRQARRRNPDRDVQDLRDERRQQQRAEPSDLQRRERRDVVRRVRAVSACRRQNALRDALMADPCSAIAVRTARRWSRPCAATIRTDGRTSEYGRAACSQASTHAVRRDSFCSIGQRTPAAH